MSGSSVGCWFGWLGGVVLIGFVDWLVGWLACCMDGWMDDWIHALVDWFVVCLVGLIEVGLVDMASFVAMMGRGWLVGWLVGWTVEGVVGWLAAGIVEGLLAWMAR